MQKRFTIEHDNIKIHYDTEKEVKDYLDRIGRKRVVAYEHKVIFERTSTHIKIDRL